MSIGDIADKISSTVNKMAISIDIACLVCYYLNKMITKKYFCKEFRNWKQYQRNGGVGFLRR